jgi:propanol-preferring alcohol dehydrogenase
MHAMLLSQLGDLERNPSPLKLVELPDPLPLKGEILVAVAACGVCHTELDEIEGRTPPPRLPVILGHQIVGRVAALGEGASRFKPGDRVGIAWIYSACGECRFCRSGLENLCPDFRATGRDAPGGYATAVTVPEAFAHALPPSLGDLEVAPLLCAGAIGYRSVRLSGLRNGQALGLTGFGASAHLVLQMVRHQFPASRVYVFARSATERAFAMELGAVWAGPTEAEAPEPLHAIIDTTPAWRPVLEALKNLEPGGRLVINAIRKQDGDKGVLQQLSYPRDLWLEKEIKSVANVSRADVREFLALAAELQLRPEVREYPLQDANRALQELRRGQGRGAKVLRINGEPFSGDR